MRLRYSAFLVLGFAAFGISACSSDSADADPPVTDTTDAGSDTADDGALPDDGGSDAEADGDNDADIDADTDADADADADAEVEDTTPPHIVSITPENGATKLKADEGVIVITFSEPMDKTKTETAFSLEGSSETNGAPIFSWSADGTVLTIDPKAKQATGDDPATVEAKPFAYALTTAATDLAGNPLEEGVSAAFTLYRLISYRATFGTANTDYGNASDGSTTRYSFIEAGFSAASKEVRGFLTFDITTLPDDLDEIQDATLKTGLRDIRAGQPFDKLGDMLIEHVSFDKVDGTHFDDAYRQLGVLIPATPAPELDQRFTKDVTVAVREDFQKRDERNHRSQYRIRFAAPTGDYDTANYANIYRATEPGHSDPDIAAEEGLTRLTIRYLIE